MALKEPRVFLLFWDRHVGFSRSLTPSGCNTIVEATGDPDLREVFRRTLVSWLEFNFSEIAEAKARKAHAKIRSWLTSENIAWAHWEFGLGDIEAQNRDG